MIDSSVVPFSLLCLLSVSAPHIFVHPLPWSCWYSYYFCRQRGREGVGGKRREFHDQRTLEERLDQTRLNRCHHGKKQKLLPGWHSVWKPGIPSTLINLCIWVAEMYRLLHTQKVWWCSQLHLNFQLFTLPSKCPARQAALWVAGQWQAECSVSMGTFRVLCLSPGSVVHTGPQDSSSNLRIHWSGPLGLPWQNRAH